MIQLSAETYLEVVESAILEIEQENRKNNNDIPLNGRWILDNFPRNRDQWNDLIERGIICPDDVIVLRENSPNGNVLIHRWYEDNQAEIDRKNKLREEKAAEEWWKIETMRKEKDQAYEDATKMQQKKEETSDGYGILDEDDTASEMENVKRTQRVKVKAFNDVLTRKELPPAPEYFNGWTMPPESPELTEFKQSMKLFELEWPNYLSAITGTGIEPLTFNIINHNEDGSLVDVPGEQLLSTIIDQMEKYKYIPWEVSGIDLDEDEDDKDETGDDDLAESDEEADQGSEEDHTSRNKKKNLGDLNYFCPVALKENNVMWP